MLNKVIIVYPLYISQTAFVLSKQDWFYHPAICSKNIDFGKLKCLQYLQAFLYKVFQLFSG